jgi:hypothetical protein
LKGDRDDGEEDEGGEPGKGDPVTSGMSVEVEETGRSGAYQRPKANRTGSVARR